MKVSADRRGDFFLMDFQKPFEWFEREEKAMREALCFVD